MNICGCEYARGKTVKIPEWAKAIRLVANGIDGYPPYEDQVFNVQDFIDKAHELQTKTGGGEWDVLVYACSDANAGREYQPYGRDNPYRKLRSNGSGKVKHIADISYMRWDYNVFPTPLSLIGK